MYFFKLIKVHLLVSELYIHTYNKFWVRLHQWCEMSILSYLLLWKHYVNGPR